MPETLTLTRTLRAPPARVFEAWTTPAQMEIWWGPVGVRGFGVEVDLQPGGAYRIGNRLPDGAEVWISGIFEVVEPPHRLVYSWAVEPAAPTERVTVRFESIPEGTRLTVVHTGIRDVPVAEEHRQGWIGCLSGLLDYLQAAAE